MVINFNFKLGNSPKDPKDRFNIGDTRLNHNTIVYPVAHLKNNKYLYREFQHQHNLNQQNNLSKSLVNNGNKIIQ